MAIGNKEKTIIKLMQENYSIKKPAINELIEKYCSVYTPEDILLEREARVEKQKKLIEKYNMPLLCIRVNYPGIQKNNYITLDITNILCRTIFKAFKFKIKYRDFNITAEGPIVIMIIDESKENIKKESMDIEENHVLGRLTDIDVYSETGKGISRKEFGLKERKCYICGEPAQNCVRQRKHDINTIKYFIKSKYESYLKRLQNVGHSKA